MTGKELKALISDDAQVYLNGLELLEEDVEIDNDGDAHLYTDAAPPQDDEESDDDEEEDDDAEDES